MSNNRTILIVSGEDENMRETVRFLENQRYDVLSETSVFQAVVTVTETRIDALILDIDELGLMETEFLDVVKKINQDIFILILFSHSNREKAIKYLERGADCYILKPFYINELLVIINKFLDRAGRDRSILRESPETYESVKNLALRIAHEINNPLTTISGQLQLRLSKMEDSDPDYHIFSVLEEESQRIAETVKSLVAYAEKREPNREIVNMNDILKEVITSFRDREREKKIKIIEAFDNALPMVMADKEQITLVCRNIISNAGKAIDRKGVLKIVSEKGKNGSVNIAFCDSGKGIPSGVVERVFDPFFVVNYEERGMGLGLCVSHNIINKHGGTLTVKSKEAKGTIFQIALPTVAA